MMTRFCTRPVLLTLLGFLLLSGWVFAGFILVKENTSFFMALAVIIPALLAALVIYLQHNIFPSRQKQAVTKLVENVEASAHNSFNRINSHGFPEEIRPLVHAVNDLMAYSKDRYTHERAFTANASHELRTPLAGIRLQAEIALKARHPDQQKKALENILKATDRGTRLVEQLLVLSRLTADNIDLAMEAVSLGQVATDTVAELIHVAEAKHIVLTMHNWDDCYIDASEDSIGILINNLIRNAITYCPADSNVDVDVTYRQDTVELTVTDTGPGIPEDKHEHVMGRFQKAERGSKLGSGLGLAIVKRIADLHGATIELGTGKNGKGLKVTVTFEAYGEENRAG